MKTELLLVGGAIGLYLITRPATPAPSSSPLDWFESLGTSILNSGIGAIGAAVNGASTTIGNTTFSIGASNTNNSTFLLVAAVLVAYLVIER